MQVRSFDVFDTCLVRRVAVPADIFYLVAEKVFRAKGISPGRALVESFVAARVEAERTARRQAVREEVTLADIWRCLTLAMGWPDEAALQNCELEAENETLTPVSFIRRQVQSARREGCRVVFISDMYLPGDFIEQQLKKHGFAEAGDGFYVSSERGRTKASGNLFREMLEQEKISAALVLHTGDNEHSDGVVPRGLGMSARLFAESQLTATEQGLLQASTDSLAVSRLAGAMRAFRLGADAGDPGVNALAAEFVAPFVMGFAIWVLQRAQADGIKRLYFLSRDCQLLGKVARQLAPQFGNIDCQYLHVSRQALFFPSASAISPEGMPWMARHFEDPILSRLLAKLELKYEDVESGLRVMAGGQRGQYRLRSPEDWACFWRVLNEAPNQKRILDLIASRRAAARSYFAGAGLFDPTPWAIVDLGWHLNCQSSLWKLLKSWGRPEAVRGYYLGLSHQRLGAAEAGIAESLIYERPGGYNASFGSSLVFSYTALLEHVVGSADHATVRGYQAGHDGRAQPEFSGAVTDDARQFCERLHAAVLGFAGENKNLTEVFLNSAECELILGCLLKTFAVFPSKKSVLALGGLSAANDQNNLNARPMVKPLTFPGVLLPVLVKRHVINYLRMRGDSYWLEGSLAVTSGGVKNLLKLNQWASSLVSRARHGWFRD